MVQIAVTMGIRVVLVVTYALVTMGLLLCASCRDRTHPHYDPDEVRLAPHASPPAPSEKTDPALTGNATFDLHWQAFVAEAERDFLFSLIGSDTHQRDVPAELAAFRAAMTEKQMAALPVFLAHEAEYHAACASLPTADGFQRGEAQQAIFLRTIKSALAGRS